MTCRTERITKKLKPDAASSHISDFFSSAIQTDDEIVIDDEEKPNSALPRSHISSSAWLTSRLRRRARQSLGAPCRSYRCSRCPRSVPQGVQARHSFSSRPFLHSLPQPILHEPEREHAVRFDLAVSSKVADDELSAEPTSKSFATRPTSRRRDRSCLSSTSARPHSGGGCCASGSRSLWCRCRKRLSLPAHGRR